MDFQKCWCPTVEIVLQTKFLLNLFVVVVLNKSSYFPIIPQQTYRQKECTKKKNCLTDFLAFLLHLYLRNEEPPTPPLGLKSEPFYSWLLIEVTIGFIIARREK